MSIVGTARRRFLVVVGSALVGLLAGAEPAAAHGVGAIAPTNYLVRVRRVTPAVEGLSVGVVELGSQIELRNTFSVEVTVLGYDEEPYLRVGPEGVWRNERSPATFWNRQTSTRDTPPERYDAEAPPEWSRVSSGSVARWHDHRAHWMGGTPSGGRRKVLGEWTVVLERDGERIEVFGEIVWVPGPSPWPWIGAAAVVAAAVALLGRTRRARAVLVAALVLLVGFSLAQIAGEWGASAVGLAARLGAEVYLIGGVALGAAAALRAVRAESPAEASAPALLAGVLLTIAGGLVGLPALGHSQVPTTLEPDLARALVSATLGLGAGVVVVAATQLRSAVPDP